MPSTRWTDADLMAHQARMGRKSVGVNPGSPLASGAGQTGKTITVNGKPSKYRNVRITTADGTFDSKKECQYWQELKLRQAAGEISQLRRQVEYSLYAPLFNAPGMSVEVARYNADFVFRDRDGVEHVQDVKGGKRGGTRTAMYALKRRWLSLQSGIEIEEV